MYMIECVLGNLYDREYNELSQWNYSDIPAALGCKDWITEKCLTIGDLQKAFKKIEAEDKAAYIEICIDKNDVPPAFEAIKMQ